MVAILKYIQHFFKKEFSLPYILLILLMIGVIIYFNYWHGLENKIIASRNTGLKNFIRYYFLYLAPFAAAFFLQLFFYNDCRYYKSRWFWLILFLAPAFFSFRVNFNLQQNWVNATWPGENRLFYLQTINWITRVFVVLIPVYIVWWVKDRKTQPFYGTGALVNLKPYLFMLLLMMPLIALASTQNDFLQVYPKAKILTTIPIDKWTDKWRYLFFELSYGFDFVSIEFFFRGFLILALLRICGTHCIIPVACFYCMIHLGKPMGEAISSFFGGSLLGIIAFNTRSIWGGLIVHLGIAWMMEIGGCLGLLLLK